MESALFKPITLRGLTLSNRIVISPMCQYSAIDGCATDWHLIHLGNLAVSGAGLLIIEAAAVEPQGRISRECLGMYSDDCEAALARVLAVVRRYSNIPIGIQLSHAGRKGSQKKPTDGRGSLAPEEGGWLVDAPSAIPFIPEWQIPQELNRESMDRIVAAFVDATERCSRLGLDMIELHGAHGYLISSFLSPIANQRTDIYGGNNENRMRYPLEIFCAVRAAWPQDRLLGVRCNGTDWDEKGITPNDAVAFSQELKAHGCDYVDVSTGGNSVANIPLGPGYQVPFASRVRREAAIATIAVGQIRDPHQAEAIIAQGDADLIAIGRGMLNDPRWAWHAAEELGVKLDVAYQYIRAATRQGIAAHFVNRNT